MSVQVGIRDPLSGFASTNTLRLLPRDAEIGVRCFVDRTVVECFFQGGRVALTMPLAPVADASYCHFAGRPPRFQGYGAFARGDPGAPPCVWRAWPCGTWVGTIWLPADAA